MTKRNKLASTEKPILKTVTTLAEERGLDPVQLEKESIEHGFGITVSGVHTIDETQYNAWVANRIKEPKKKSSSQKSLSESNNKGVLTGNPKNLKKSLKENEKKLKWLENNIDGMSDGIDKKFALRDKFVLIKKIEEKRLLINGADKRLNYLLDHEIEEIQKSISDLLDNDEVNSSSN